MSDWHCCTLGQLVDENGGEVKTGPFGSQLHESDYVNDPLGVPVVMPKDMVDRHINYATAARISHGKAQELQQHITQNEDVLIPRRGNLGRHVLIRETDAGTFCGTGSLRVRLSNSLLLPGFLSWFLATDQGRQQLESKASGVTMPNISTSAVREVEVRFPGREEQKAIIAVLDAYDELIENNLRRIETLEEMAQMIYREWFVNFRFSAQEHIELEISVVGPVPKGWPVGALTDVIEVEPATPRPPEGLHPFIPMTSLKEGSMLVSEIQERGFEGGLSRFLRGDTLFPGINPSLQNGKTAFVGFLEEGQVGLGSTELIPLRSKQGSPEWVYCLSRDPRLRDTAINSMTGASGRQRVKKETVRNYLLALPPTPLLAAFSDRVRPSFELIENLRKQIDNLRTTRDFLLPRLISGEIDVSELDIDTSLVAS